jgi:hypothetical protein
MYIKSIKITNIRSIRQFEMKFDAPAGWHVVIGDNGAGKSSVVRSIAAVLTGPEQILAVLPVWDEWLRQDAETGSIEIELARDERYDGISQTRPPKSSPIRNIFRFTRKDYVEFGSNNDAPKINPKNFNWGNNGGWFSVAYGPFRRFTGGDNKWNKVFYSAPKAGAHLSVFGEDIALTEALDWLKELDRRRLKQKEADSQTMGREPSSHVNESEMIFLSLQKFINRSGLLPYNTFFDKVDINGEIVFIDAAKNLVKVTQMSDGYRSILSMTFELIRQLVRVYGSDTTFLHIKQDKMVIDLPGVVLIDEIDAHLHPTWQTRIGQWFTHFFPNIQFIVTTHSPLICRASERGSIWRLAAPGSDSDSIEVTGQEKDRLVFGNILDAYGTEIFGRDVSISMEGNEKLNELAELNIKSTFGEITKEEESKRIHLKTIFPTEKAE